MPETLEFSSTQLNPRLLNGDIGAAFAEFAFEALDEELPRLRRFKARGKDGAIDLSATTDEGRTVVECKHVGDGSAAQMHARWREVADRLDRNLEDAAGPPPGQPQYGPWYRREPGIETYLFCVSARFANQQGADALEEEIGGFFETLARERPHLAHLANMRVRVVDFAELLDRTSRRPHLLFRWFPATRPLGLMPLDERFASDGFRTYLTAARLPHYSLRHHRELAPLPEGVEIEDEGELLATLGQRSTGLVITGAGGLGKTRLTSELGQLARDDGWTVLRALPSVRRSSIERLAEELRPGERTLLLFDYIEVLHDFQDLVGLVNDLNDQYDLSLRYIANCRRSYYNQVAPLPRHHRVNLSPVAGEAHAAWFAEYQRAVVHHILAHSGLDVRPEHVRVCRQTPVLAVFLAYLHDAGRETQLSELLDEQDFTAWVLRRVRLSIGRPVDRELAQLMMLFPFGGDVRLPPELQALLDLLAADGWVEQLRDDAGRSTLWVTAHDVLADQIVVSHLDRVAMTARGFIDEALTCGERLAQLPSALAALQRVVDAPALASVDWPELLGSHIAAAPDRWRTTRDWLLETALLTHDQQIALLAAHPQLWDGAEHKIEFQNRIGYLSRWVVELEQREHRTFEQRATIEAWAARAAAQAEPINYVITWGLRLAPERVRETALRWIEAHPFEFQTHYLLVGWLRARLPTEAVADHVASWVARYPGVRACGFVFGAWLEAGGEPERIRGPLEQWLAVQGEWEEARYAYAAWLWAGGDRAAVEQPVERWLARHPLSPHTPFVCAALLRSGADAAPLRAVVAGWLEGNPGSRRARVLYEAWLHAGGDTAAVREPLQRWLASATAEPGAGAVYAAWLLARGDAETIAEPFAVWLEQCAEAEFSHIAIEAWLDGGHRPERVEAALTRWLGQHAELIDASFLYRAWLDAGGDRATVRDPIERWLERHAADAQADYVYRGWIRAGGELALVAAPMERWLSVHGAEPDADFGYCTYLRAGGDVDVVRAPLARWLAVHAREQHASFVLRAWLEAGGEPAAVRDAVRGWLEVHGDGEAGSFVFQAWQRAGGEPEVVRETLVRWLAGQEEREDTRYPVQAWLEAGGDAAAVQHAVERWLAVHAEHESASFTLRAWLDAGGDPATVRDGVCRWLAAHGHGETGSFVLQAWLRAGGDPDVVEVALLAWLELHARHESASFVLQAALDAGVQPDALLPALRRWLENGERDDARFVLQAWLERGGDPAEVRATVERWLELHSHAATATFVLQSWLRGGGDPDVVEDAVRTWLEAHPDDETSRYMLHAWLTAGGAVDVVRATTLRWLAQRGTAGHARFVLRAWLDAGGEPGAVQADVERWLELHAAEEIATFVLQPWLRAGGDPGVVQAALHRWLAAHGTGEAGSFVLQRWLQDGGDPAAVQDAVERWLRANTAWHGARYVLIAWLRAGGDARVVRPSAFAWLRLHRERVEALFVAGELIRTDRAALTPDVVEAIVETCRRHPRHHSALWCLSRLGALLLASAHAESALVASEAVLGELVRAGDVRPGLANLATQLLARLVRHPQLQNGEVRARVDVLFLAWLRCDGAYPRASNVSHFVQHRVYFQRFAGLVEDGAIDWRHADRGAVERFLAWVDGWLDERKQTLGSQLQLLARAHPAPGLWDRVTLA